MYYLSHECFPNPMSSLKSKGFSSLCYHISLIMSFLDSYNNELSLWLIFKLLSLKSKVSNQWYERFQLNLHKTVIQHPPGHMQNYERNIHHAKVLPLPWQNVMNIDTSQDSWKNWSRQNNLHTILHTTDSLYRIMTTQPSSD
jgi:hypothetical protein